MTVIGIILAAIGIAMLLTPRKPDPYTDSGYADNDSMGVVWAFGALALLIGMGLLFFS